MKSLFPKCEARKNGLNHEELIDFNNIELHNLISHDTIDVQLSSASSASSSSSSSSSSRTNKFVNECVCDAKESNVNDKWQEVPRQLYGKKSTIDENKQQSRDIECTLAIIKPQAMEQRDLIEKIIIHEGFAICQRQIVQLTTDEVGNFYGDSDCLEDLISLMICGPVEALVLAKYHAIEEFLALIGPEKVHEAKVYFPQSLRARFGSDSCNGIHGSGNFDDAQREIRFFFPQFILEPLLTGDSIEKYLMDSFGNLLDKGLHLCRNIKPADPLLWFAEYLQNNNPNQPKYTIKPKNQ